jgi:hypothetical protein
MSLKSDMTSVRPEMAYSAYDLSDLSGSSILHGLAIINVKWGDAIQFCGY